MSEHLSPDVAGEGFAPLPQPQSQPQSPPPRDPQSFARMLIARLGERATSYAMHQALKARQHDDQRNVDRWLWIAGATREILRSEPNEADGPSGPA